MKITQAKKILESLKADKHTEHTLLSEGILLCEHLTALSSGNIEGMKLEMLKCHVGQTHDFWAKYPLVLQLRITNRYAQQALIEACRLFHKSTLVPSDSSSDAEWRNACKAFTKFFQWDPELLTLGDQDAEFQGDAPTFQATLLLMLNDMTDLEEAGLSIMLEEDEDPKSKSKVPKTEQEEAQQVKAAELASSAEALLVGHCLPNRVRLLVHSSR